MITEDFTKNVPDWREIKLDNAQMILEEGKDYVKHLTYSSDKITNRAFAILAILIPITSAMIGYAVTQRDKPDHFIYYIILGAAVCLIVIMFGLGKLIFPRLFMTPGRAPKEVYTADFLGLNFDPDKARLALVLNEIKSCQKKIDYNESQISDRMKLLKVQLIGIGLLFTISTVAILIHVLLL